MKVAFKNRAVGIAVHISIQSRLPCHIVCQFTRFKGCTGVSSHPTKTEGLKNLKITVITLLSVMVFTATAQTELLLETGKASFYHDKFVGRKTASGEKFSQKKYTCAHRTLPFGTQLKVTNLKNGKTVVVTVNDRGPFTKGRLLDLSKKAAQELDFISDGITNIVVERVVDPFELPYTILNDSVRAHYCVDTEKPVSIKLEDVETQERLREIVNCAGEELGQKVMVQTVHSANSTSYIVFVGIFYRQEDAHDFLDRIEHYYPEAEVAELALASN